MLVVYVPCACTAWKWELFGCIYLICLTYPNQRGYTIAHYSIMSIFSLQWHIRAEFCVLMSSFLWGDPTGFLLCSTYSPERPGGGERCVAFLMLSWPAPLAQHECTAKPRHNPLWGTEHATTLSRLSTLLHGLVCW